MSRRRIAAATITLRLKRGQSKISTAPAPAPLLRRETRLTLRPGQDGTKRRVERNGERLVRVR
jgi:hypothetical protein